MERLTSAFEARETHKLLISSGSKQCSAFIIVVRIKKKKKNLA